MQTMRIKVSVSAAEWMFVISLKIAGRFCRPQQDASGLGGAVETGFPNKFDFVKTDLVQYRQEILSRYRAALSFEPIRKAGF